MVSQYRPAIDEDVITTCGKLSARINEESNQCNVCKDSVRLFATIDLDRVKLNMNTLSSCEDTLAKANEIVAHYS